MGECAQTFTITLDGVAYPVEADEGTITVNGRPFKVEVDAEGRVLVDGIAYDVALESEEVRVDENVYPMAVEGLKMSGTAPVAAGLASAVAVEAGAGAVQAIMPGKIIRVLIEVGQQVEEGDPICVLEAMKMENELNARQGGTVKAVHVVPGEDVEKDQVLVEIE
ncbi:MAG TPA: biotin/lipoyl-binding protein [Chloroflexi bacterium]|nr:biotin/lipoyl-binding protein [Chloroflexota bacterium]